MMDDNYALQAATDQLIAGSREIARATRAYYQQLFAQGFEEDQAVVLAGGYQAQLMSQLITIN